MDQTDEEVTSCGYMEGMYLCQQQKCNIITLLILYLSNKDIGHIKHLLKAYPFSVLCTCFFVQLLHSLLVQVLNLAALVLFIIYIVYIIELVTLCSHGTQ